jgi:hypothetical protein
MSNEEVSEEPIQLDLDKVRENIPKFSSEKLCEMIVCDRYFGMDQQISIMCMQELATRRIQGDVFPFETYIDQSLAQLPVLNFVMPDLRTTLSQMAKMGKK